jgi:hypothetical protein
MTSKRPASAYRRHRWRAEWKKSVIFNRPINENHHDKINMSVIRATIYLTSGSRAKPFKTCYFAVRAYERLMKDYAQYLAQGEPRLGAYREEVSGTDEHSVLVEFAAIAEIRTNQ